MVTQSCNKALLTGIALLTLIFPACKPNEADSYAQQLGLPAENRAIVRQLEWDPNTKALMDELTALPKTYQLSAGVLDYLKGVAADKKTGNDELQTIKTADEIVKLDISDSAKMNNVTYILESPEARNAYDSLKSYSEEAMKAILEFGLYGDIPVWIALNSTLPKDAADYNLATKSGIQDKKFTDLESDYLKDKEKYKEAMFNYYVSEIGRYDQEIADKFRIIPFFREIDEGDVEAAEDVLHLFSDPENRSKLEKIFGKGIERKMWPVSGERLVYNATKSEFDVDNPFFTLSGTGSLAEPQISPLNGSLWYPPEEAELRTYLRLAEFQEKYNKEMDQPGVPGPKPAIRGINLLNEPLGNTLSKSQDEQKFEYALIRWALRCNTVRLYCRADYDVFYHVKIAQSEGLDTWLLFFPLFSHPDMSKETYKNQLVDVAKKANQSNVPGLFVGAEFDAWWRIWGGYDGNATQYNLNNNQLKKYIDDLVKIVRQNYSGQITYQEWDCWYDFDKNLNWDIMDVVSPSPYIASYNKQFLNDELYLSNFRYIRTKYSKPLVIAEVGSLTISESEEAGGLASYVTDHPYHHNPEKQADVIDRHLRLLYQAGVDGVFLFEWDEPVNHPWGDMNKLGFGIWDYVKKEPKPSFWTVYKYYKE